METKQSVFLPLAMIGLIICSASAYWFLSAQKSRLLPSSQPVKTSQGSKAHDTAAIKPSEEEFTPELELLNYVLRKGKEGIPVLLLKSIF